MTPYWTSPDERHVLYCMDALTVLRELPDCSVQCCVTSPPYWGLRDYGTATWEGGEAGCDHKQSVARHDGGRENVNGFHGSAAMAVKRMERELRQPKLPGFDPIQMEQVDLPG